VPAILKLQIEKGDIMKQILKKAITIIMAVTLLMVNFASATTYGKSVRGTYVSVGGKLYKSYYYNVYKINKTYDRIYENKKLTPVIKHTKNTGTDSLSFSTTQSLSKQTVVSYNSSLGITVNATVVSITEEVGCGSTTTTSISITTSASVNKEIPSSAPTGYYSRALGRTYYEMKVNAQHTNSQYNDTYYFKMPYGDPVIYTIYSSTNASGSYVVY
jgi:hypothetical protein